MIPVTVTSHAITRARERVWPDVWGVEIRNRIRREVELALDAGRVASEKPRAWRRSGLVTTRRQLGLAERFVYTADGQVGWIVKLEPRETVVVTTLCRVEAREVA